MSIGAVEYSTDFYRAGYRKNSSSDSASKFTTKGLATQETARDLFSEAVQKFHDDNRLTAQEFKEEKDWREMTDEEWDKMLEGVDEYIDAFKERLRQLKEIQNEAAQKAALEADSEMRAAAASAAALSVAANGFGGTSEADTESQTVLRTAKEAQEMEKKALSRFEEVQLIGATTVGVSQTDTGTECASVEEDENKEKVWTITAFTEKGIVSNKCQNGKIIDSWELKYTNPNDAKKVQDFLDRFEKDANLIFSGSKDFWEEFLSSDMDADS